MIAGIKTRLPTLTEDPEFVSFITLPWPLVESALSRLRMFWDGLYLIQRSKDAAPRFCSASATANITAFLITRWDINRAFSYADGEKNVTLLAVRKILVAIGLLCSTVVVPVLSIVLAVWFITCLMRHRIWPWWFWAACIALLVILQILGKAATRLAEKE
jgi:hypothetical protein